MIFQRKIITVPFKLCFVLILLLASYQSFATHYRAGEILYEQITERRYKIIAYSYTDPSSLADANTIEIDINLGDGTSKSIQRTGRNLLSNRVVQNIYETTHEYRSDGKYIISFYDQNRVNGIMNINNGRTEFIAFYVETEIRINSSLGPNRSPVLTKPPIDNGCRGIPYYHNPSAYDPDGDSLVFSLIDPKDQAGNAVPLYSNPDADFAFRIGINDGQLFWDNPKQVGIYNIAIEIREFRRGIQIGYIVRDMQIFIDMCTNDPPIIQDVADGCVVVGDSISRIITATDPNTSQQVRLVGLGGAFAIQNVATINPDPAIAQQTVTTQFKWKPSCNQVRHMPWQIIFEARDNQSNPAVSQNSFFIKVIAPPIINLHTQQFDNGFRLTWNRDTCNLAAEYHIYRRIDSSGWNPETCETGIPAYTGFVQIANIKAQNNPNATSFYDDNGGKGLSSLVNYCYRIVAIYPPRSVNGNIIYSYYSESKASDEICDNIILSKPSLIKASVVSTSGFTGKIDVSYIRPDTLDTLTYLPPYRLVLKRSISGSGIYTDIASADYTSFNSIADIHVTDSLLNTEANQYLYKVEMWATMNGVFRIVDSSQTATSVYASIYCTDRTNILSWKYDVPWLNDTFIIYRKNALNAFDSIATVVSNTYTDTGLVNKTEYCYKVLTSGYYRAKSGIFSTYNFSQEICGTPIDTVRPCPPILLVIPPCDEIGVYVNKLNWVPIEECSRDVVTYKIYYKQLASDEYSLLDEVPNTDTAYLDKRDILKESITGCYYVAGVDSAGNESFPTNESCIENCPQYEIPNVFTPNNDGKNDLLIPFPYRFVSRIDLVMYNRWGVEVFKTTDKDILWDGKDFKSKQDVSEGVYFYTCLVYEIYLDGVRKRVLNGTVQVIRE